MANPNGNPSTLRPPWRPGESGNPNGPPKGRSVWKLIEEALDRNDEELKQKAAEVFASKIARGHLRALTAFSDRVYGPLVRKLEVDHRMVVGIVAHFEIACREIAGEEQAARIVARTLELVEQGDAGTDPERTASESVGGVPSTPASEGEPVREVS